MTRIRRSNHIFVTWKGDHSPSHVHVYRDSKLIVKWDLQGWKVMDGEPTRRILDLIRELREEGRL